MKITHAKFLKLLSAELGQDEKITGIHLNGLISEIINTTEEGKPFEISGFGSFSRKDGKLQFEPDERLAAEINFNYEGMPEIDVNEAKSVIDDEAAETDIKPVKKSDTIIVDDGVANEVDVTEPDPFEDLAPSQDNATEPEPDKATDAQSEAGEEADPFGISDDDSEEAAKTTFVFDEEAAQQDVDDEKTIDENAVSEQGLEAAEQAVTEEDTLGEGSSNDESPFDLEPDENIEQESVVSETDEIETTEGESNKATTPNDADAKLDSFIASRFKNKATDPKTAKEEDESSEPKFETPEEQHIAPEEETKPEEASINLDEALGYSDEPVSEKQSELIGSDDTEESAETTETEDVLGDSSLEDGPFDEAQHAAPESTLADTAAQKPVKKPEPVAKVGNIVGKKTPPAVPPKQKEVARSVSVSAESANIQTEADAELKDMAKEKPLPSDRKRGESNFTLVLIAVAAVILIAVGAWWYFGTQADPIPTAGVLPEAGVSQAMLDETTEHEAVPEEPTITDPEPTESDLALAAATNWEEPRPVGSPLEPTPSPETESGEPQGSTTFGLRGEAQPMEGRVFSIVVHSLPSRIDGNIQCDEIARLGLRCVVVEARVDNRITYRVGIGQFETYAEAQQQVAQLPEPYRSRNFPARIN